MSMMLRPQACFLASDNRTISEKRGVIGSHHGESLCSLLVEVKIIMSTLNNDGINLSITTPRHCIGAVGVGVADVQPPPVHESISRVVGPQFLDLFWPVACGVWDLSIFNVAGGTRVEGVIHTNSESKKRENTNSERGKREKFCHLGDSFTYDGTIEKVSNFEIVVAKLKET